MLINHADWVKENREYLIKQAELLQNVITRMANNSLAVKQVGLTVWAAIVGFGFTNKNAILFVLAFGAFALFGVLDIYYLYLEKAFRKNFNRLSRILGGYAFGEDEIWVEQMQQQGRNFLIPDLSPNFLGQLFSKDSILKSWANLPYLITLVLTIVLLNVPLS
ncbi:MAG: hypothetical protein HY785_21240 [Oscillatoriophycideae cyanobacterium NC_groundwater_1537_Pr4_S-0.65um_50_18]|nr:hypothetical protein [Oscillatoriophycideae cyanobacterium NC_groundwater_1537_Pr4_S-0.65um_50_18]